MNEVGLNAKWIRKDLPNKETQDFAEEVLNHMRNRLVIYQEKYGDLYNLEATPAESTSFRLAKHDRAKYPDIICAGKEGETPYYTNSSHLPVGYTEDIFSALDIEDRLQTLYTSGTVFHAFLGEKLPTWKAAAELVRKIAENYKLPYYTLSPTYSVCPEHGYIAGEHFTCPHCGKKAEVYSRITGYYRPVQNWNDGKAQEYKDRKTYKIDSAAISNEFKCKPSEKIEAAKAVIMENAKVNLRNATLTLFVTPTCPNCKIVERLLDQKGIKYNTVDATTHKDEVEKLGIASAPTLLLSRDEGVEVISSIGAITNLIKRF